MCVNRPEEKPLSRQRVPNQVRLLSSSLYVQSRRQLPLRQTLSQQLHPSAMPRLHRLPVRQPHRSTPLPVSRHRATGRPVLPKSLQYSLQPRHTQLQQGSCSLQPQRPSLSSQPKVSAACSLLPYRRPRLVPCSQLWALQLLLRLHTRHYRSERRRETHSLMVNRLHFRLVPHPERLRVYHLSQTVRLFNRQQRQALRQRLLPSTPPLA